MTLQDTHEHENLEPAFRSNQVRTPPMSPYLHVYFRSKTNCTKSDISTSAPICIYEYVCAIPVPRCRGGVPVLHLRDDRVWFWTHKRSLELQGVPCKSLRGVYNHRSACKPHMRKLPPELRSRLQHPDLIQSLMAPCACRHTAFSHISEVC